MKQDIKNLITSSILAGFCIGLAGTGFLLLGGLAGKIIFSCGLILVVANKFKLFTGTAGFTKNKQDIKNLLWILIFNIVGCLLMFTIAAQNPEFQNIQSAATKIVETRLSSGWWKCLILSVGCGFLMTEAVEHSREKNFWLPLLFCVPMFIVCGFPHCIADAFYWIVSLSSNSFPIIKSITVYLSCVMGNYIGCNLKRVLSLFGSIENKL